ncbi:hypothetical protein ACQ4PT_060451 [Festuca glaucescens]
MESASDPEVEENPDVWELFRHYDRLYFRGALDDAAFAVEWTSPRMKTCSGFGCCSFGSKTITLYQPMLQYRTKDDLKNALLHLMIHAILFVKYGTTNVCKHGPVFRDWMDAINACSIDDYLRPKGGYCITTTHDFSPEELQSIQGNLWKCESCGDTLVRATRLGPPSDSCCIENVSQHATCGNMLCYWHNRDVPFWTVDGASVFALARTPLEIPLQPRVTAAAQTQLAALAMSLQHASLSDGPDTRLLPGGAAFSTAGAYRIMKTSGVVLPLAEHNWSNFVPLKVKVFFWVARHGNTRTRALLHRHGILSTARCPFCNDDEDLLHLFFKCPRLTPWFAALGHTLPPRRLTLMRVASCLLLPTMASSRCHKMNCGGTYVVPAKRGQKMVTKGKRGFLTETSETSKSQDAVQESDSDEVRENYTVPKPNTKGKLLLLSQMGGRNAKSPGSSSSRKASKSNTAEDFQKAIVPATPRRKLKLKQEFVASEKHELFSGRSCNNAKSLGSCSSKKAEDFQKEIVSSASPLSNLKRKQTSVASEKHELRSVESFYSAKSSRSDTSRKASRWHKPEDVQKSNVQPAASQKELKLEEDMTLSEKYGVFSPGSYKNTKPPGSSTSRKASTKASTWHKPEGVEKSSIALPSPTKKLKLEQGLVDRHEDTKPLGSSTRNKEGKLHKPEGIQKASVQPATAPRKLKQNLVASEKNELSSSVGCSNANVLDNVFSKKAHKQRKPEETRKPIVQPAAPQSIPKQQNITNSSAKTGKQHSPQEFQKTFAQRAVSQSKLKQSNHVAPERQKTRRVAPERQQTRSVARERKKRRSVAPGKKKEYACVSVWANIYESECSSGSAEPLVNKRTERRKRERERAVQITYSRSRKRSASGMSSVKAEPAEEEVSSKQAKPPPQSQCLEFILIGTAHKVVTRDQSRRPAPRMNIVVAPPADQVKTQTPRGQSQPPTQTLRDQSQRPAASMDIVGVSPVGRVTTRIPRGQFQPPAQCMNIVIPPADLAATQAHADPSVPLPSTCMDIAAIPSADQVMTRAPVHQSQPPPASAIATDSPDVIDISDDD